MIIQEFYCDDDKILTIIHENMDGNIKKRVITDSILICQHNISFKEYYVNEFKFDENNYDLFIEGFLDCNNEKNPYREYSTFYKEFVNFKRDNLFEDNTLTLPLKEYNELSRFIKEYSNYNFTKYSIGNLLVFSPIKIKTIDYLSDNLPYLKIMGDDVKGRAFVKFKVNNIILDSIVIDDIYDGQKVFSKYDWNNYEIEIFEGMEIIYKKHHNLIRNIDMNFNLATEIYNIHLKNSNKQISLIPPTKEYFTVGERKHLDYISYYLTDEFNFYSNYININEDKCTFLRKNEREKAYDLFVELTKKSAEIWIFDPFFLSQRYDNVEEITDFLMILINNNHKKNIVFSKNQGSFEEFRKKLTEVQLAFFKEFGFSNVDFIESKEYFHDRFMFFISDNKIDGVQIGTSINSLGTNYSNIVKLSPFCCQHIFKILMQDIVSENIFKICD